MKYFVALLVIIVGVFFVIKTEWILNSFGTSDWAEEHLGTSGGSRLFYKLIGVTFIFLALTGASGILGPFILRIFGRLFGL